MRSRLDELAAWEQELAAEQDEVAHALEPLLQRREELRSKLELVQRLKRLELGDPFETSGTLDGEGEAPAVAKPVAAQLQHAVREILLVKAKPMHIRDIRAALAQQGVPIPGRGTDANLIVHLRRAPDTFDRLGRGIYGLKDWKASRPNKAGTR